MMTREELLEALNDIATRKYEPKTRVTYARYFYDILKSGGGPAEGLGAQALVLTEEIASALGYYGVVIFEAR